MATITGTNGNDTLRGTEEAEVISGRGGDDTLDGRGGADRLDGGPGNDTVTYRSAPSAVVVDLSTGRAEDGFGSVDTLVSIGHVEGSSHADTLTGNDNVNHLRGRGGDDQLFGLGGDDVLEGGAGSDRLDGGPGSDMASYRNAGPEGVLVRLSFDNEGTADDGQGGQDTLVSIGNIEGSAGPDHLSGNGNKNHFLGLDGDDFLSGFDGDDRLEGGAGNDILIGDNAEVGFGSDFPGQGPGNDILLGGAGDDYIEGSLGDDFIDGGPGNDTVSYSEELNGNPGWAVTVDLAAGTAISRFAGTDQLVSVGHVDGSWVDDTLLGNDNANILRGIFGDDMIDGRGGADTLIGMSGDDTLDGGRDTDRDVFVYELFFTGNDVVGSDGNDTIRNLKVGDDVLRLVGLGEESHEIEDSMFDVEDNGVDTTLVFKGGGQIALLGVTQRGPGSYDSLSDLTEAGIVELA